MRGRCDALAVSNSTFSFAAAMLASAAPRGRRFLAVRPEPAARRLQRFDPWDALPILKQEQ